MSFLGRIKPKYITLNVMNDGTEGDTLMEAVIVKNFNHDIIDDASKYVCAVERMELSVNAIPVYNCKNTLLGGKFEEIICTAYDPNGTEIDRDVWQVDDSFYGIDQLINYFNKIVFFQIRPYENFTTTYKVRIAMTMDANGFFILQMYTDQNNGNIILFDKIKLSFPTYLNYILGFAVQPDTNHSSYMYSAYPRLDCGDELNHIIISSNLPTVSDNVSGVMSNCLTDFAPPTVYQSSSGIDNNGSLYLNGYSLNCRQRLIYTPTEKRYLDMISNLALREIQIRAFYVTPWGATNIVNIPIGGTFVIKLGFYEK